MKKSLIFLLGITLTSFNVFHAQSDFLLEPISFKITDTLVVNEINQPEVFENLLEWIALNFNSANNVIQYQNKERGKIILKGILQDGFRTEFTLSLNIIKNGWNYSFTNIKSLQYNYYEAGEKDCFTKQCRANFIKWKEGYCNGFYLMIKNISIITLKK
jgi:hypothetical protein